MTDELGILRFSQSCCVYRRGALDSFRPYHGFQIERSRGEIEGAVKVS